MSTEASRLPDAIAASAARNKPELADDAFGGALAPEVPINILLVDDEAKT